MGNRTKITNVTMQDVTKDELIQYFFVPEGCGGAFRIPANKDAFLAWVENKRNGTLLEAGQTAQDAAMKSLNEYVRLVKKANDEKDTECIVGQRPQWIQCSERMPEKYRFVLVCRKRGGWFIADWDGKNWHTDGYLEIEGNGIAAWMPLPKLWKDET